MYLGVGFAASILSTPGSDHGTVSLQFDLRRNCGLQNLKKKVEKNPKKHVHRTLKNNIQVHSSTKDFRDSRLQASKHPSISCAICAMTRKRRRAETQAVLTHAVRVLRKYVNRSTVLDFVRNNLAFFNRNWRRICDLDASSRTDFICSIFVTECIKQNAPVKSSQSAKTSETFRPSKRSPRSSSCAGQARLRFRDKLP
jgi:hypothetical protein